LRFAGDTVEHTSILTPTANPYGTGCLLLSSSLIARTQLSHAGWSPLTRPILRTATAVLPRQDFGVGTSSSFATIRGLFLLFDYLFKGWNFRKLYLEVPSFNLSQFTSAADHLFDEEARLVDYVFLDGEYWDLVFLALDRAVWRDQRQRLGPFIDGGVAPAGQAGSSSSDIA
jgi:hypothetical protein